MLRSLLLAATAAAAIHGPGKIDALGTVPYHPGAPTVLSDGARYIAFARSEHRVALYDSRTRRTVTITAGCTHPAIAAPGLFLLRCGDYGPDAVVVEAGPVASTPSPPSTSPAKGSPSPGPASAAATPSTWSSPTATPSTATTATPW
jgi:hypothetical protein